MDLWVTLLLLLRGPSFWASGTRNPEYVEQLARTIELGCDIGQGYLLSRPLRPAEVPAAAQRRVQDLLLPVQAAAPHTVSDHADQRAG